MKSRNETNHVHTIMIGLFLLGVAGLVGAGPLSVVASGELAGAPIQGTPTDTATPQPLCTVPTSTPYPTATDYPNTPCPTCNMCPVRPTNTPYPTSTPYLCPGCPTSTRTPTNTPTRTPTLTFTPTSTDTPAPTPTYSGLCILQTVTPNPTYTPRPTAIPTATRTPCPIPPTYPPAPSYTPNPTYTSTATPSGTPPTATPTPTRTPPPATATCVPGGIVGCVDNGTTCNLDTYTYSFDVTTCPGTFASFDIAFEVAPAPVGPWTPYDQQTIGVSFPSWGRTVTGSFSEPNIPLQYTDYRFVITGPPWFGPLRRCTQTAALCRAPSATPSSSPTPCAGCPTPTPCAIRFSDTQPTDYFYTAVQYLACHGMISGYADGTFRPYNPTTRAQMVKIVVLGFALPLQTPAPGAFTFADVPPSQPFFAVIETAAAQGVVSGYDCGGAGEPCDDHSRPYFRPAANVTRGQLSKIAVGAAGWPLVAPLVGSFADVAPGSAFYTFVETAACHGIVSGYDCGGVGEPCDEQRRRYFRQTNNATRGQIAKIVYGSLIGGTVCP